LGETMIIMRKRLIPGTRAEEGLRLSAAMLGMDYMPNMVFVDDGVDILLPDALYKNNLKDYLTVMSDMAGVYAEGLPDGDVRYGRGLRPQGVS